MAPRASIYRLQKKCCNLKKAYSNFDNNPRMRDVFEADYDIQYANHIG